MRSYPIPFNEAARLDALAAVGLAARDPDPVLDAVARMAQAIVGSESALVSLVEADRQVFVARADFPVAETPRQLAICAHVVARDAPVAIEDAHADPVFRDHPVVTGPPHIRSYFGAPIRLSNGLAMGSLCALGTAPHPAPPPEALARLADLADLVGRILEERAARGGGAEALRRAEDRAQEEFLALVGHELRTPLTGVLGLGELLDPATEDQRAVVEALRASAELMAEVVERLVGFADLRAGRVAPQEAEIAAEDLLGGVAASLGPRLAVAGRARPEIRAEPGLRLRADPAMLALALDCLATNALVHGAGRLRLAASREAGGEAVLSVEDEGPGIAPERREAVERVFAVGAPLRTRATDGLGLGLPLTRRLVELHGGGMALAGGGERPFRATLRLPRWRVVEAAGAAAG